MMMFVIKMLFYLCLQQLNLKIQSIQFKLLYYISNAINKAKTRVSTCADVLFKLFTDICTFREVT